MTALELIKRETEMQDNKQDIHSIIGAICIRTDQFTKAELLAAYNNQ